MTEKKNETALRSQYEAYPYPPRDPLDEQKRLVTGSPSHLAEINHYIYAGERDFSKPFHVLIAGGGTGDAAIMVAQQLADQGPNGRVTYLDLSEASMTIAKERADTRGLTNIDFRRGSIMDLGTELRGPYDYIDCCGVLHHLDDPGVGLRHLCDVLADGGGMGLMVYAPYGRTGVYQMQEMLRLVGTQGQQEQRLAQARALLDRLPPTNWLRRNPHVSDHLAAGDAGLFDLLLHSQDRAFTVPELAAMVDAARLRIVSFIEPIRYDPTAFLGDQEIAKQADSLSWIDKCAFAELLIGNLKTHVFYVVKSANKIDTVASLGNGARIPVLVGLDAVTTAMNLWRTGVLPVDLDGLTLSIPMDELSCDILQHMDGKRTIDEIFDEITARNATLDRSRYDQTCGRLITVLNGLNIAFLRR
jgi:SAM-dependent methyltransferase